MGDRVALPHGLGEPLHNGMEQEIAELVSVSVVDVLEVIDVHEQNRKRRYLFVWHGPGGF